MLTIRLLQAMVTVLKLNDTTMTPDELVELIRQKRNESSMEAGAEEKIMKVSFEFRLQQEVRRH